MLLPCGGIHCVTAGPNVVDNEALEGLRLLLQADAGDGDPAIWQVIAWRYAQTIARIVQNP